MKALKGIPRPSFGLLAKFAIVSAMLIALLGLALAQYLKGRIEQRALATAADAAVLSSSLGIQPLLSPADLERGLSPERFRLIDRALRTGLLDGRVTRIKIWNRSRQVVYSDDLSVVGRTFPRSDDLEEALAGEVASEISRLEEVEEAGERAHGTQLEVYVPLRFEGNPAPAGAFEVYLPYKPIAAEIASDTRTLYLLLAAGLLLLYGVLFRIARGASRRLKRQADDNEHQALHDSLTGLPNRNLLRDRVHQALASARRRETTVAVVLLDLDRFKDLNDTLGHQSGDELLRELGARLGAVLREGDTIARLGGDEFGVLLPDVTDAEGARAVADRLRDALEQPFLLDALVVEVEGSMGIALFPGDGEDVDTLLRRAEVAMYRAKETHAGTTFYASEHDRHSAKRLLLVPELRRALEERQLVLHFQPKTIVPSGEVRRAEALVRWEHPERGLLPPAEFVPLAERTGMMRPLTLYVIDEALRNCRAWHDDGLGVGVAVNLSARDLHHVELPEDVAALLARWRLDPEALELEITESTIMIDPQRAHTVLSRLSELGVRLAIDDFGTGYSSLAYLKRLPIDVLKIDKSFVMNMQGDQNDAVIVRSTIELGHNLGLEVAAEGVESERILNDLVELGCDVAQGYYLSRPLPGSAFTEWLRDAGVRNDRAA